MLSITWSHILVFLLFHISSIASASSSSPDSDSSKDSSSREKVVLKAQSAPEDKRTKAENLDDNAVPSQHNVQPHEQTQTDSPTPVVPPTLAPQPELHPASSTSDGTGIPAPPNFHGFSFFIGFMTGFALLVIIVAGVRLWIHHRAERRIPYTIY
ncbi:hypothetical protein GCK32_009143 [Trichostrongylus colubriformis]|uniref:Uncharacterized protein n=1 Tax=Trichostrongylus colubriformis TaxID=6319 RepID=A0AAN8EYH9_TRICO